MSGVEEISTPGIPQKRFKRSPRLVESEMKENILSPRFRSAAANAGWDEEALLVATLVVEDTPVRESSLRRRLRHQLKSPSSSSSNRKRKSTHVDRVPAVVLCLVEDEEVSSRKVKVEMKGKGSDEKEDSRKEGDVGGKSLPCMDRLREELSCAICLEICYEPSTTPCGHSFCKKCLQCAADKCGKRCPKCRQLISIGKSCTVNTVLWNTIQLLFSEELEPRKKKAALESSSKQVRCHGLELERIRRHTRHRNLQSSSSSFRSALEVLGTADTDRNSGRRRRLNPNQSEDAALALRLQREEIFEAFRTSSSQQRNSIYATRARLRTMASGDYRMRNRNFHEEF